MLAILAGLEDSDAYTHTVYLAPASLGPGKTVRDSIPRARPSGPDLGTDLASVIQQVPESDNGLVVFRGVEGAVAVAPPFPIEEDSISDGGDMAPLVELLVRDRTVGVVLLRLGRYAVGVLRGDDLLASRSGSRYVKSRHRKGGSSQRRFERSRERLVRELFDKTCETARGVFTPYRDRIDNLLMGGEGHTLMDFERRCSYFRQSGIEVLRRRLAVDRPGKAALESIHREVWRSRVYEFARRRVGA